MCSCSFREAVQIPQVIFVLYIAVYNVIKQAFCLVALIKSLLGKFSYIVGYNYDIFIFRSDKRYFTHQTKANIKIVRICV